MKTSTAFLVPGDWPIAKGPSELPVPLCVVLEKFPDTNGSFPIYAII
jgi:hypothetical protein